MNPNQEAHFIEKARIVIKDGDPSHDINHSLRVLNTAKYIASIEGGDLDILVPCALYHDVISYPKNDPRKHLSQDESAEFTGYLLMHTTFYPASKIQSVMKTIKECSFTKGIIPDSLESKILQDADALEATGAIAIMRTFSSTGQMKREFYNPEDPFCFNREPEPLKYAIDLFYARLLKVEARMHTQTAKKIAKGRTEYLHGFLEQLKNEIAAND